jgi:hypothetical protein
MPDRTKRILLFPGAQEVRNGEGVEHAGAAEAVPASGVLCALQLLLGDLMLQLAQLPAQGKGMGMRILYMAVK